MVARRFASIVSGVIAAGALLLAIVIQDNTARICFGLLALVFALYAVFFWKMPNRPPRAQAAISTGSTSDGCLGALFLLMIEPWAIITGPLFLFGLYWFWPHWQEFLIGFAALVVIVAMFVNL